MQASNNVSLHVYHMKSILQTQLRAQAIRRTLCAKKYPSCIRNVILIVSNIFQTYLNRLILEDRDRQIDEVRRKYENDEDRSQEEVMRIEQETVSHEKNQINYLLDIFLSIRGIVADYQMHKVFLLTCIFPCQRGNLHACFPVLMLVHMFSLPRTIISLRSTRCLLAWMREEE